MKSTPKYYTESEIVAKMLTVFPCQIAKRICLVRMNQPSCHHHHDKARRYVL